MIYSGSQVASWQIFEFNIITYLKRADLKKHASTDDLLMK